LFSLKRTIVTSRTLITEIQGEYIQQREYGNIPSFGRTQRTLSTNSADYADQSSTTMLDEPHTSANSNIYRILPNDCRASGSLTQIKLKLEALHPSQRDYVFAQLLHDVS
jgi:hypothetical protein